VSEPPRQTTYSLLFDTFVLGQRVRQLLATTMSDGPLRPDEYAIYSVVFEDEAVSPTEMANLLAMPLTTVVDAVRAMERRGHARRVPNPRDGRSYLVVLTGDGLAAHREAGLLFARAYDAFVDALPLPAPAVRDQLAAITGALERATERMTGATAGERR